MKISKICVLLVCMASFSVYAQQKVPKKLKRLGLTSENMVYGEDDVPGYPHGLIYATQKPDSVYYFGCFASDEDILPDYFDDSKRKYISHVNKPVYRIFLPANDTLVIPFKSLESQLGSYTNALNKPLHIDYAKYDYVLIYYWCKDVWIKEMKHTLKSFQEFVSNNPEKRIKFITVCTDKPKT